MDLLHDAGQPLPADLVELDILTPFGTFFRYEYLSRQSSLDRKKARTMVQMLRVHVESKIGP